MGSKQQNETASRLLRRGGQVFGLALMAHLHEAPGGSHRWYALTPDTRAAAEEIRPALAASPDPQVVEAVIRASMSPGPAVSPPAWCRPLWDVPGLLRRVGGAFSEDELTNALGPFCDGASDRAKGIAALALSLCRSLDGLYAAAAHFEDNDGTELVRRGHLAHNTAEPGQPSGAGEKIRKVIEEVLGDG